MTMAAGQGLAAFHPPVLPSAPARLLLCPGLRGSESSCELRRERQPPPPIFRPSWLILSRGWRGGPTPAAHAQVAWGAPPRASFRHGRQGDGRQQLSSAVAGGTTAGGVGGCGRPGPGSPTLGGVPEPRPKVASQAGGEEGGREALGVQGWPCFAENTQLPGAQAQSRAPRVP